MANVIKLNTTENPGLTQVLIATDVGLFDWLAEKSAGSVTLTNSAADQKKKAQILKILHPATGKPLVAES